jgi:GR25 family glycosyltransferase involved in LPS biosynthesis
MKDELKHVGIDDESDYFSWVYDYPSPTLDVVYNDKRLNMNTALKSSSRDYIKRVSMKHYQIVKEAYSLGYGRILVLENDVRFHRDRTYIKKMLSNMPDTDIVMFDKMVCSAPGEGLKYQRYVKTLPDGSLYGSMNDSGVFFIFCSCYALNRNAMKHIIDAHEKNLLPPDTPLNDKTLTGSFAVINLAIQDPKLKTRKSETYDKIGLNTGIYGPVSDEEKVVKNDPKPKQVAKPQPPQQAKPKPIIKPKIQKQDNSKKVVFRVPPKHHLKKKLEVDASMEPVQEKQVVKHTKPTVTRFVNSKKSTHSRIIVGKSTGFNKLYDV